MLQLKGLQLIFITNLEVMLAFIGWSYFNAQLSCINRSEDTLKVSVSQSFLVGFARQYCQCHL